MNDFQTKLVRTLAIGSTFLKKDMRLEGEELKAIIASIYHSIILL